ncbi:MAG: radical SAM protein [Acidimicrobiales bacterium]|nr:radical SAM protein [Acidimicrobiales bacterium]HRW36496.1 radical SAM protein [Aquihabitans sp.]
MEHREQYDEYVAEEPGRYPKRMDFILSISCNLQCVMCNGDLSSSIRIHREKRLPLASPYGDAFFEELEEFLPHLERSVFLGGEPFVGREPQRVFDLMIDQGHTGTVQVITNGTHWNERVERYLRELPMNLTVSIDGYTAETLEPLRVGVDRDRLFANVDRYQEVLAGTGRSVSFHYCLMRQNWHEFGAFLLEADRRDATAIVMTVTGPASFSLWDLPAVELRTILDGLEEEDRALAPQLGRNRGAWVAELDRIRRHVARLDEGEDPDWVRTSWVPSRETSVELGRRSPSPGRSPSSRPGRSPESELRAWAGRAPLVLHVADGVIGAVEREPWADPLEPERWVGLELSGLSQRLAGRLGPASPPVVETYGGLTVARTVFDAAAGEIEFRSIVGLGLMPSELRILLATDADLISAGAHP